MNRERIRPDIRWGDLSAIVTGSAGFLGSHLVETLRARGLDDEQIVVPRKADYDLRSWDAIQQLYQETMTKVKGRRSKDEWAAVSWSPLVCACYSPCRNVGGIGNSREHPGELFYDNLLMGIQLMEAARKHAVHRFVAIGTIRAYPKFTPIPFRESKQRDRYGEGLRKQRQGR